MALGEWARPNRGAHIRILALIVETSPVNRIFHRIAELTKERDPGVLVRRAKTDCSLPFADALLTLSGHPRGSSDADITL